MPYLCFVVFDGLLLTRYAALRPFLPMRMFPHTSLNLKVPVLTQSKASRQGALALPLPLPLPEAFGGVVGAASHNKNSSEVIGRRRGDNDCSQL